MNIAIQKIVSILLFSVFSVTAFADAATSTYPKIFTLHIKTATPLFQCAASFFNHDNYSPTVSQLITEKFTTTLSIADHSKLKANDPLNNDTVLCYMYPGCGKDVIFSVNVVNFKPSCRLGQSNGHYICNVSQKGNVITFNVIPNKANPPPAACK